MGISQDLYRKAKTIIPGGTQLLSKRPEMYLPELWPAYYQNAKGCTVTDLDGHDYYDFANMGVGSCVLGYANDEVNEAVIRCVLSGSMSTLNAPEEVELAEKLVEMHPWADMARFSRTGGEACAIAVRIARAATGKGKVAFCGYHGWHDWYLSSNLGNDSNLDGQLLTGLEPRGVPRSLANTALPFKQGDTEQLRKLFKENPGQIGTIIMEPGRYAIDLEFLKAVRAIATEFDAVLIFDEITAGFRKNVGGIHLTCGVEPDMAVFGKALGNGFPISAIIGRREIMNAAQGSFISSTYWTEKIGFVAALKVLEIMQRDDVPSTLIECGNRVSQGWKDAAAAAGLEIGVTGIEPLTYITFKHENPLAMQTFYTQEMLERGFLAGPAVYATAAYTEEIIRSYIENSAEVFKLMKQAVECGNIEGQLQGPVKHSGFKRLN